MIEHVSDHLEKIALAVAATLGFVAKHTYKKVDEANVKANKALAHTEAINESLRDIKQTQQTILNHLLEK